MGTGPIACQSSGSLGKRDGPKKQMHFTETTRLAAAPRQYLGLASCLGVGLRRRKGWPGHHQGCPRNRSTRCAQASTQRGCLRLSLPELTSTATIATIAEAAPIAIGRFECRGTHSRKSVAIAIAIIDDRHCSFEASYSFACFDFTASSCRRIRLSFGKGN